MSQTTKTQTQTQNAPANTKDAGRVHVGGGVIVF
jgi:hypothetical protein